LLGTSGDDVGLLRGAAPAPSPLEFARGDSGTGVESTRRHTVHRARGLVPGPPARLTSPVQTRDKGRPGHDRWQAGSTTWLPVPSQS